MNQQFFSFIDSTTQHKIKNRENCRLKLVNLLNPCGNYRQMHSLTWCRESADTIRLWYQRLHKIIFSLIFPLNCSAFECQQ